MNWLQKIAQFVPPSYMGVGHGYRFNDMGEAQEVWQSGDTKPVILWSYEDGRITEDYRTRDNNAHWSATDLARGRIETGSQKGSVNFTTKDPEEKKKIIEELIAKYSGVKFFVYGEPGSPFDTQEYWSTL